MRKTYFEHLVGRRVSPGEHPPFGGTALLLAQNRDLFAEIGWQVWQCERVSSAFFQEFEHSKVYGIYQSQKNDLEGQMFALYKNGTWDVLVPVPHIYEAVCGKGSF